MHDNPMTKTGLIRRLQRMPGVKILDLFIAQLRELKAENDPVFHKLSKAIMIKHFIEWLHYYENHDQIEHEASAIVREAVEPSNDTDVRC